MLLESSLRFVGEVIVSKLSFLVGKRFVRVVRREFDWEFQLDGDTVMIVECLWRLICTNRIRLTSEDDGHRFGLPARVLAANELNTKLAQTAIVRVELRAGTLDLRLTFDNTLMLEIIPDSSGYEAWNVTGPRGSWIAVGGGELAVFPKRTET